MPQAPRRTYPFREPPELSRREPSHYPVIVVGAGPTGLAAAIDLAQRGIGCLVLDDDDKVSVGSRAICWAKRTLEIFDRLGVGQPMLDRGVTWNVGKVFFGDSAEPVYTFDLLPEPGHHYPAFINLQQYYAEELLIERLARLQTAQLRWRNTVTGLEPRDDVVHVQVQTPAGAYRTSCDYLIAADGSKSTIRQLLGLEFSGEIFHDHFLIADILMQGDFPAERWFWFDPPFNPGQSALLHRQPDRVWRLDFQLGWDIDREAELDRARVSERIRGMLGDVDFEFEWVSIYTFQCRWLRRFRHGRILFIGDAAHLVSPFGARGANGGVQDVDNLIWKLASVLEGRAPHRLLESYDAERVPAAEENILNSTRSSDFITPKSPASRACRDAVLGLARDLPFARRFVNSGRLSVPAVLDGSPLNTPDTDRFAAAMRPGSACADAPVRVGGRDGWLLRQLGGDFMGLYFSKRGETPAGLEALRAATGLCSLRVQLGGEPADHQVLLDADGLARRRYDAEPGSYYLIRPDQHIAGRWRRFDAERVRAAVDRATAKGG